MDQKLKFIEVSVSRHGLTRYYYRRAKGIPRVRLPDDPMSPEFARQYREASEKVELIRPPTPAERMKQRLRKAIDRSICNSLARARSRAITKGWDFDLSREWARGVLDLHGYRCPVTCIAFDPYFSTNGRLRPFGPSIDRIDNSKGYTQDNCRIVITAINVMLNDWGLDVVRQVGRAVAFADKSKAGTESPSPLFRVRGSTHKPLKGKGF